MGLRGEAGLVEHGKQKVARAVAGEGPAGAVGAVRAGREAQGKHAGMLVAEGGDGFAPVLPIGIGAAAHAGHFGAILAQARAAIAGDDLCIQGFECSGLPAIGKFYGGGGLIALHRDWT